MKQLFIVFLAVLTISCDGQKSTPTPEVIDKGSPNSIDTLCITCNSFSHSADDSLSVPGRHLDIKKVLFAKSDGANLLDPATYQNRAAFFSFLKTNASIYDNNLIVYIARRDTTLFCYRQGAYNSDTRLPIMSASKAVTAAVIMSLVESNKLSLDDRVSRYIPSFNNEKKTITIRQLLTHTSGIVVDSPFDSRSNITLQQNIDSVALKTKLLFTPGTRAIYGSVGFSVASRVAEVVEKKPWAQIFQERIGSKCGMEEVVYSPDHPSNPATGYGIVCSMNEYLRFLTMIYNKGMYDGIAVLKPGSIETMEADNTNNVDPTYGLGVFRSEIQNNFAKEVACQSATGIHGWINREKNFYGLIFTQAGFDKTIKTNLAFRKIVRDKL